MSDNSRLILLGPQRLRPTVGNALGDCGVRGVLAVVTAGWQERESEDDELREHVGLELINLELYRRVEEVLREDIDLFQALRERQDRLKQLQELYRARLEHQLAGAREMLQASAAPELLEPEQLDAIEAVRALDAHHLDRVRRIRREFERQWRPATRPAVLRHRQELLRLLDGADAVALAGGHVAVLLNRLALFDLAVPLRRRTVVAWSAGAMVLAKRVVAFHDSPPQGPGHPEILDAGLGLFSEVIPLPHADTRLRLDDRLRVSLLARRLAPARGVALNEGARLERDADGWRGAAGTRGLSVAGTLREVGAT